MITGIVTYAVHYSLANVISCNSLMLLTDKEKMLKGAFCPLLLYFLVPKMADKAHACTV